MKRKKQVAAASHTPQEERVREEIQNLIDTHDKRPQGACLTDESKKDQSDESKKRDLSLSLLDSKFGGRKYAWPQNKGASHHLV